MSVFKRLTCKSCGYRRTVENERAATVCERCGGKAEYSEKWYVTVTLDDSLGRKKKVTQAVHSSKRFAEEYESKLIAQRAEGKFFDKHQALLFEDAAETFLEFCRDRVAEGRLQPRTFEMYEGRMRSGVLPFFRGIDVKKLHPETIDEYKKMRMQVVSPASVNRELATIKRMMAVLIMKRLIVVDPSKSVTLLREDNKRERYLTEQEIEALYRECKSPHLRIAVVLALNTGLRLTSILTLKWSDISFKNGEIVAIGKGRKQVRIPMTGFLRQELISYRKNAIQSINNWVIPSPRNPAKCMEWRADFGFKNAVARAGLEDFRFHDLRHTFATHFLARTKDIHTLANILGHSAVRITERYAHLLDDQKRNAMRLFEGGLS